MPGTVPPVSDERDGLLSYLRQQRDALRVTAHGLSDEQARLRPTAGTLSIGGLVKHVTDTERTWIALVKQQRDERDVSGYLEGFTMRDDETLAQLLDDYALAASETEKVVADVTDLGQAVPVPPGVPWFPADVEAWSVRWVLLHLIEETARHGGHADIVRESIDGATFHPLMAAAEGWPATPWLQPWKAAADR
jgi:uncharacterized damage-inducible protein DinB